MIVSVNSLTGASICQIEAAGEWQVFDLKANIATVSGIPRREQRLLVGFEVLKDDVTLSSVFAGGCESYDVGLVRVDDSVGADYDFMMNAVVSNPQFLAAANENLRGDASLVLAALRQDGTLLRLASEDLRSSVDIVAEAMASNPASFQFALGEAALNKTWALKALEKYAQSSPSYDQSSAVRIVERDVSTLFEKFAESLQSDFDVALMTLRSAPSMFSRLRPDMRGDRELLMTALDTRPDVFQFASSKLRSERDLVLRVVKLDGAVLQYADKQFQNDEEIIIEALKSNGLALEHVAPRWRKSRDMLLLAVQQNGLALEFAHKGPLTKRKGRNRQCCHDAEVVHAAVQQCGLALEFASDMMRSDPSLVSMAVSNASMALQFASPEFLENPEIAGLALSRNTVETGLKGNGSATSSYEYHVSKAQYDTRRAFCSLLPPKLLKKLLERMMDHS